MLTLDEGRYTGRIAALRAFDGAVVSVTRYARDAFNTDWHRHENLHLSYSFGSGSGESRSRFAVDAIDDVSFYRAGEEHRWAPATELCESINLEVRADSLDEIGLAEEQLASAAAHDPAIKLMLIQMHRELRVADADSTASLRMLLLELARFADAVHDRQPPRWARLARDLLNDAWNRQVTLDDLAEYAGVHAVTISRSFRQFFGMNFGDYRRKLRLARSLPMVRSSTRSLTDIALHCGFSDHSHFTRCFRAATGIRPNDYRRHATGN